MDITIVRLKDDDSLNWNLAWRGGEKKKFHKQLQSKCFMFMNFSRSDRNQSKLS